MSLLNVLLLHREGGSEMENLSQCFNQCSNELQTTQKQEDIWKYLVQHTIMCALYEHTNLPMLLFLLLKAFNTKKEMMFLECALYLVHQSPRSDSWLRVYTQTENDSSFVLNTMLSSPKKGKISDVMLSSLKSITPIFGKEQCNEMKFLQSFLYFISQPMKVINRSSSSNNNNDTQQQQEEWKKCVLFSKLISYIDSKHTIKDDKIWDGKNLLYVFHNKVEDKHSSICTQSQKFIQSNTSRLKLWALDMIYSAAIDNYGKKLEAEEKIRSGCIFRTLVYLLEFTARGYCTDDQLIFCSLMIVKNALNMKWIESELIIMKDVNAILKKNSLSLSSPILKINDQQQLSSREKYYKENYSTMNDDIFDCAKIIFGSKSSITTSSIQPSPSSKFSSPKHSSPSSIKQPLPQKEHSSKLKVIKVSKINIPSSIDKQQSQVKKKQKMKFIDDEVSVDDEDKSSNVDSEEDENEYDYDDSFIDDEEPPKRKKKLIKKKSSKQVDELLSLSE